MRYPLSQFESWLLTTEHCTPLTTGRYLGRVRTALGVVDCPEDPDGFLQAVQDKPRLQAFCATLPLPALVEHARAWGAYLRFLHSAGIPVDLPPSPREHSLDYPHRRAFLDIACTRYSDTTLSCYDRSIRSLYRHAQRQGIPAERFTLSAHDVQDTIEALPPTSRIVSSAAWRGYTDALSMKGLVAAVLPRQDASTRSSPRAVTLPNLAQGFERWLLQKTYASNTVKRYVRAVLAVVPVEHLDEPQRIEMLTPADIAAAIHDLPGPLQGHATYGWRQFAAYLSEVHSLDVSTTTSAGIKLPDRVMSAIWMLFTQAPTLPRSFARSCTWRDVSLYAGGARFDGDPRQATRARVSDRAAGIEFNWVAPLYMFEELWHFARGLQDKPGARPLFPTLAGGAEPLSADDLDAILDQGKRSRLLPLRSWHDGTSGSTAPEPPAIASEGWGGALPLPGGQGLPAAPASSAPLPPGYTPGQAPTLVVRPTAAPVTVSVGGGEVEDFLLEAAGALEAEALTLVDPDARLAKFVEAADLRRRAIARGAHASGMPPAGEEIDTEN